MFAGVDLILHAGDIVQLSVLEELRAIAPVEAVAGNMDDAERSEPSAKKVLTAGKFRIGLIHGKYKINIQREMIRQEFDDVDLIVYGHSHAPFWGKEHGVYFLNPGSPTDKRYAPLQFRWPFFMQDDESEGGNHKVCELFSHSSESTQAN